MEFKGEKFNSFVIFRLTSLVYMSLHFETFEVNYNLKLFAFVWTENEALIFESDGVTVIV